MPAAVYAVDCETWVAKLVSIEGAVDVRRYQSSQWSAASLGQIYCAGDQIRVGGNARASVELTNDTVLRLDQRSTLLLPEPAQEEFSFVDLVKGALHLISRVKTSLEIRTPFVNAGLEGTEFVVRVLDAETVVSVIEGKVAVSNPHGRLSLVAGQSASGTKDAAPVLRLDLKPEDAVQWAIYYPLITDPDAPGVAADIAAAQRLLFVGRVDEAQQLIDAVRTDAPDNSDALAIASIVELAQNNQGTALELATQAVELAPASAMALLALSFAQQGGFELEAATASVEQAIAQDPQNAIAWSRLAELRSSLGDQRGALQAAERAVELNPKLSRTLVVLGFAQLVRLDTAAARTAFNKAIELDSADPLARLGLGLAKIRDGELADGRRDMEIAVSLDPSSSLVRSYLGKAYFEERRNDVAGTEFELAKQLDPRDPTPWLYDAYLKQSNNDPVTALRALGRSVQLNKGRAVYRSRLLLDQDHATRSASLGQIYAQLGFESLALTEGWRSIYLDPTDHASHRLLSDVYRGSRREDSTRLSELMKAHLLQPTNVRPILPQSVTNDLATLEQMSSYRPSQGEFSRLFDRNGYNVRLDAFVGNHDTYGDDVVVYGLEDRFSYSLSQFLYKTDGFRSNNDQKHESYNVFGQLAVTDALMVQAEGRFRNTDRGDIRLRFDPTNFFENDRSSTDSDVYRLGGRFSPSLNQAYLASIVFQEIDTHVHAERVVPVPAPVPPTEIFTDVDVHSKNWISEIQYIRKSEAVNWVIGGGYLKQDSDTTNRTDVLPPFVPGPIIGTPDISSVSSRYTNAYVYSFWRPNSRLTAITGFAFDSVRDEVFSEDLDHDRVSPKFGLLYKPQSSTLFRAAAFRTVARPLLLDTGTIDLADVAGFPQVLDTDLAGSKITTYGVAVDHHFNQDVRGGISLNRRDLEVPSFSAELEDQYEENDLAYLYWTPSRSWAFGASVDRELFERDLDTTIEPNRVRTISTPIRGSYQSDSLWSVTLGATYVDHKVRVGDTDSSDRFWLFDAEFAYVLPRRYGKITVSARNLFDKNFNYLDQNFRLSEERALTPRFLPERSLEVQISIALP